MQILFLDVIHPFIAPYRQLMLPKSAPGRFSPGESGIQVMEYLAVEGWYNLIINAGVVQW